MAEQTQSAKGQVLNERTYQEVEYLKKNLGPILVAALAEICIRRPADPIEYLGHWLLRWRYNEELKRRDVQNALEVVRQKAWKKDDENQAPPPGQGFTPATPFPAPGFGGPLDANAAEAVPSARTSGEPVAAAASEAVDRRVSGEERRPSGQEVEAEPGAGEETRRPSEEGVRRPSESQAAGGELEERRASAASRKSNEMGREPSAAGPPPAEESATAFEEPPPAPASEEFEAPPEPEPEPAPEEITAE